MALQNSTLKQRKYDFLKNAKADLNIRFSIFRISVPNFYVLSFCPMKIKFGIKVHLVGFCADILFSLEIINLEDPKPLPKFPQFSISVPLIFDYFPFV